MTDCKASNAQRNRFVEAFVGEAKFNASEAARIAGYSERSCREIGRKLRKDLDSEIQARLDDLAMTSAEVTLRLAQIARNEASRFFEVTDSGGFYIDVKGLLGAGLGHLIKGVKQTAHGTEIIFQDPQAALELLARHHGLLKDKVELSGPGGGPLALSLLGSVDAAELQRRVEAAKHDLAAGGVPAEPGDVRPRGAGSPVVE